MFTIEMLPANEGDALWIEYGSDPVRRILIDCGRRPAYREIARRTADLDRPFELFVLTHVDADHITGGVPLLQDPRFKPEKTKDVWFNGWLHLNGLPWDHQAPVEVLGAQQGEFFSALLRKGPYPWNEAFDHQPVVLPPDGPLPRLELEGGMVLTLLGPTVDTLDEMRARWKRDLASADPEKHLDPGDYERALEILGDDRRAGPDVLGKQGHQGPIVLEKLIEIPFDADGSEPNGSSISFLAEFDGKAVLFGADAHSPQIEAALQRLLRQRGSDRLRLDALKMAHHGSARNTSPSLLDLLDCPRYLISTDGTRHHHPDPAALARVVDVAGRGVEFHFNYASDETRLWDDDRLRRDHGFATFYPQGDAGLIVRL